jgi:hypothetical protein
MFPIATTSLNAPGFVPAVAETSAVTQVNQEGVPAVGSATDAPPAASVSVELSPVASFLLTVSQSQQQLTDLQSRDADVRAGIINDATQNVVNAFNLLPAVDYNQAQPQSTSLLNNLVQGINDQNTAQQLSRVGVTLQPPLLSDATGGLSLDNEVLRAAYKTDSQATTSTLQTTLDTFSELATRFAEQLSAAGTEALSTLQNASQPPLTLADAAANARLDLARADLGQLAQQATEAQNAAAQAAQAQAVQSTTTQQAAVQASQLQTDPLRANPALASAIAAYNINDTAALGADARAAPTAVDAVPRVSAVEAAARSRGIGTGR